MATIQVKRGQSANLPLSLAQGEPAFALDTGKFYIGTGDGRTIINPEKVSSAVWADRLATARTIMLSSHDGSVGDASFDGSANIEIKLRKNDFLTAGTYPKVTVDAKGNITGVASLAATDIPSLPSSKITGLGTAAACDTGVASGNIPVLDAAGKLNTAILPAIAITDTYEAATEAAMLALTAQKGDVCIRTDINKCFILKAEPASTKANWAELKTPTDAVISVAGKTGAVTLSNTDVGLGNVANERQYSAANPPPYPVTTVNGRTGAVSITLDSLGGLPNTSPAIAGQPVAPTPPTSDNSLRLATTAFVKAQGYLTAADTVDGGTF